MAREFKAMSATNPTAGGFLIPEVYLDEVIELLYSKTVIKELGARTIPLENGNLNIPRMTSGTRAMWGGEGRKIASTQPAFGNLRLSAKRLEAIVPQTRELLMSTKYSADDCSPLICPAVCSSALTGALCTAPAASSSPPALPTPPALRRSTQRRWMPSMPQTAS